MALEVRPDSSKLTEFFFPVFRRSSPVTLELFDTNSVSSRVELKSESPLPPGWQWFIDLETGSVSYKRKQDCIMNRPKEKQQKVNPKLDLKLNLSPPKNSSSDNNSFSLSSPSSYFSSSSAGTSPPSSCISSELNSEKRTALEGDENQTMRYSNSPEATCMVLAGCPRCLMYVMLSEQDPKCPKCKSTCLLDFQKDTKKKAKNF